jgi:FkbM family methyltransferase
VGTALKRHLAKLATSLAKKMGYTILPTWRMESRELVEHLRTLFAMFEVDCVIDVGANDGGYARLLRHEVGYSGLLLSFEPVATLAARCRATAATDPNWLVFDYAAGNDDREAEINVSVYSKLSSMLPRATSIPEDMAALIVPSHTEIVQVRRLDHVLPDIQRNFGFERPYLKVDTQGFDLAVLEGAGELLPTMVAAQTELSFLPLYKDMPDWRTVIDALELRHFAISGMFPISLDKSMRAIEFDCVLINERFAVES